MAITNEATIRVRIDGKDAEVSVKDMGKAIETAMRRGKKEADKLKTSFTKIGDAAQRFYFSFQSLKIFVRGAMDFINAANQQAQAVAGMEQALRSMGRYSEDFSKQIQKLASQIQSEGVIGDEAIIEGTKFLATYKDISNETLPRTMRIMADLAAYMKGDVRSAANILGKASMGLTGELSRYGITLSESTKKSKDFNAILKEIEEQIDGQNRAMAEADGGIRAFQMTIGDSKEVGGDLIKLFILPIIKKLKVIVEWLKELDKSTIAMIGTIGGLIIILNKLIPIMRNFGIVSKGALGWISLIITALGLLYSAWTTNFLGIRDALTNFWEFLKSWIKDITTSLKATWNFIKALFSLKDREAKIKAAWKELADSFVSHWKKAFQETKEETKKAVKVMGYTLKEPVQEVGESLGEEFGRSFVRGFKNIGITGGPRGGEEGGPSLIEEMEELPEKMSEVEQAFWDWRAALNNVGDVAREVFDMINRAIDQFTDQLTMAMFGARIDLMKIWKMIAMDFTRLFIQYILKEIAKVFIPRLIALLSIFDKASNDRLAMRIGRDYARFFTKGVIEGLNPQNLAVNMAGVGSVAFSDSNIIKAINGTNSRLQQIESKLGNGSAPNVNIKIGGRQLYEGVKQGRELDLIRRGKEINNELF